MLQYRLIMGPLMLVGLFFLIYFDNRLDDIQLRGTFLHVLFWGRAYLPAGLLMAIAFLLIIAFGARELTRIFRAKGVAVELWMMILAGWTGCLLVYLLPYRLDSQRALAIFSTVIGIVLLVALVRHAWHYHHAQGALAVGSAVMFTMIYLGMLPSFFLSIRRWHSAWVIAAIIVVSKACDIGAYAAGRLWGKTKLIPWLSPGKTWEGFIGGILLAAVTAGALAMLMNHYNVAGVFSHGENGRHFTHHDYPIVPAMLAGALFALVGQFGDLTASLFKRDAGIKDSGHSVPGFGGILDVIDSPIMVAPVAYWVLFVAAEMMG